MNNKVKNINLEDILFVDVEAVRKFENLDPNSADYDNFAYKIRDKTTDKIPEQSEVLRLYNEKAGLYLTHNKIVCISVGYIKAGQVRIKAITGEEAEIIKEFWKIASKFKLLGGFNHIGYDTPIIMLNGAKYFDNASLVPPKFNTVFMKPWNLEDVYLDIMLLSKTTFFTNPSLSDLCLHFGISVPKDDISGSQVSEVFYNGGINRIAKYCNKDVFATINVFMKLRYEDAFETFMEIGVVEEKNYDTLLHELYETKVFDDNFKSRLKKQLKDKKIKKTEIETTKRLILASYLEKIEIGDPETKLKKEINTTRETEVEEFIIRAVKPLS